jgi:hypothetical protein
MWTLVYRGPGDKLAEVAIVPPVQTIANYPSSEFNTTPKPIRTRAEISHPSDTPAPREHDRQDALRDGPEFSRQTKQRILERP